MQRGTIVRRRASWTLLYWDRQFRDGEAKRVKVSKKLALFGKEYPTKASVRHLADKILAPINDGQHQPESSLKVSEYIDRFYFPSVEVSLRPATIDSYKFVFSKLDGKLDIRIRDFRTVHAQRILREVQVGRRTLIHIKAFLSAVFRHAKQAGIIDGQNPVTDTSVPGRSPKFKGVAYSINDVARMLEDLEPNEEMSEKQQAQHLTASDVVSVMSLTGLRTSECQGLRFGDWDEERQVLNINRSVWGTTVGPTKNAASENSIPVIPLLANIFNIRRQRLGGKPSEYIFSGKRGAPLSFHNLENRVIKPALQRSRALKLESGEWKPDDATGVEWKGFHGFRRGLASNLFSMGFSPVLIAAILRHGDVASTMSWYIKTPDADARAAMEKLEARYRSSGSQDIILTKT